MHNNAIKYGFGALSGAVKISSSVTVVQCFTTQMLITRECLAPGEPTRASLEEEEEEEERGGRRGEIAP